MNCKSIFVLKYYSIFFLALFMLVTFTANYMFSYTNKTVGQAVYLRNMAMKNTSNLIRQSSNANLIDQLFTDEITSGIESFGIADQLNNNAPSPKPMPVDVLSGIQKTTPINTNVDTEITESIEDGIKKHEIQVMVAVLSRRSAFETRQVIRDTWASGHDNVFFAVGTCCPVPPSDRLKWTCTRSQSTSIEEQTKWDVQCAQEDVHIAEEETKYKDIIRMPDTDVYRHLPQKVKFCYKWGLKHTTAKWFVKTDDDSVVRIDTLGSYLHNTYNPGEYVVVGRVAKGWGVHRKGKWGENNYKPSKYPTFPLGSVGHVVSKGVASYIADNSEKLFNYQGEDVSIGIWLNESPLKSKVKWVTSKHMTNHGNCKDTGMWVMGHNIKPATMKACFAHTDEMAIMIKDKLPNTMTDAKGDSYQVSPKLDIENTVNIQQRLLYMLTHFARIAEKHDIQYWLCAGTLIGAIRHKGFIPWDADIDISIPLDSYNTLKSVVAKEFPSDLWLQNPQSDSFYKSEGLPKIRDLNSDYEGWSKNHKNWHNGIQIDLIVWSEGKPCHFSSTTCCSPNNQVFPLKRVPFENITVNIPQKSMVILNNYYGDITLQPINKRVQHQGKAIFYAPDWLKKKYPLLYKKKTVIKDKLSNTKTHLMDNTSDTNVDTNVDTEITESIEDGIKKHEIQVMVAVLSRRSAFETRQVIRDTWASGHDNVFFAVGTCCPVPPSDRLKWTCTRSQSTSIEEQTKWDVQCAQEDVHIAEEETKYKDIIRMPDTDVYRHLPQKVKFCYKWGLKHTTAKWFVKTDDDSVVRIDTLGSYLHNTYNPGEYVVVGRVAKGWGVHRKGKWGENNYKPSKYPTFPLGSVGHVVSKGVASYIADNSEKLFNYQGEDVSIGIWLNESPLKSKVKWVTSKHMTNHGNCKDTGMWVMGHNIKPATMKACFAHTDEMAIMIKDKLPNTMTDTKGFVF